MKKALLIAAGTVTGLGAVLSITPPALSDSVGTVGLGGGLGGGGTGGRTTTNGATNSGGGGGSRGGTQGGAGQGAGSNGGSGIAYIRYPA